MRWGPAVILVAIASSGLACARTDPVGQEDAAPAIPGSLAAERSLLPRESEMAAARNPATPPLRIQVSKANALDGAQARDTAVTYGLVFSRLQDETDRERVKNKEDLLAARRVLEPRIAKFALGRTSDFNHLVFGDFGRGPRLPDEPVWIAVMEGDFLAETRGVRMSKAIVSMKVVAMRVDGRLLAVHEMTDESAEKFRKRNSI